MPEPIKKTKQTVILVGVLFVAFLIYLNSTIIGTATPKIVASLNGMAYVGWISSIYMLASVVCIPVFGKLSDMYGRKWFYLSGLIIFIVGSFLSGVAQTIFQLIAFRALQGAGCGIITAISSAILADIYTPAERGKAQGYLGGVMGVASIFGPLVGGVLTDKLSWRWVFFINVPIGIIPLIILWIVLSQVKTENTSKKVDWLGTIFIAVFSIPLLLALTWGGDKFAWNSPQIIAMFLISAVALIALLCIENKEKEAIIPLTLFRNSIFNITNITIFCLMALQYGLMNYMPLFTEGVLKKNASESGLIMFPMVLGFSVATILGGSLITKIKKYKAMYVTGYIVIFIGTFLFCFLNIKSGSLAVAMEMLLFGIGAGIAFPISMIIVQNAFPYSQVGTVTASFQFIRNFGGAIGVAIFGVLINNQYRSASVDILETARKSKFSDTVVNLLSSPQSLFDTKTLNSITQNIPKDLINTFYTLLDKSRVALSSSMHDLFILFAIIALISIVFAVFLKEIPLREKND
ncbi:MAG: MFS transporter [Intestinimonas sp.]|jgi:EmrB/QacA subfamily drug resistance transporter|nr:MFS transporter [Intestinimonas sp.]